MSESAEDIVKREIQEADDYVKTRFPGLPEEFVREATYLARVMIMDKAVFDIFTERDKLVQEQIQKLEQRIAAQEQRIIAQERNRERVARRGRRPGKRKLPINDWAREQYAAGKTIDELLPEYAKERGMRDLVKARELLRKAVT